MFAVVSVPVISGVSVWLAVVAVIALLAVVLAQWQAKQLAAFLLLSAIAVGYASQSSGQRYFGDPGNPGYEPVPCNMGPNDLVPTRVPTIKHGEEILTCHGDGWPAPHQAAPYAPVIRYTTCADDCKPCDDCPCGCECK